MIALLLSAALYFSPEDATLARETAESFVQACTPRDSGTVQGRRAADWLSARASKIGICIRKDPFSAPTPLGNRLFTNLYADFTVCPTNDWIVLISHYDTKNGCPGANDGASTSGLLLALAKALARAKTTPRNVMLVWTDGEECQGVHYTANDGLQGARRVVEYVHENKRKIKAAICLDMLGDRDLAISLPANSSPSLVRVACEAATHIGESKLVTRDDHSIIDDHVAFLSAGYPSIDLIDFNYGPNNAWWHTSEDTCDKLSNESLLKAGRLVCKMLNLLQ